MMSSLRGIVILAIGSRSRKPLERQGETMYQVEVVYDETNSTLRWLRVSHNGTQWSTIQVRSNDEALQIIAALQQSVHPTLLTECAQCGSVDEHIHYANCPAAKTQSG